LTSISAGIAVEGTAWLFASDFAPMTISAPVPARDVGRLSRVAFTFVTRTFVRRSGVDATAAGAKTGLRTGSARCSSTLATDFLFVVFRCLWAVGLVVGARDTTGGATAAEALTSRVVELEASSGAALAGATEARNRAHRARDVTGLTILGGLRVCVHSPTCEQVAKRVAPNLDDLLGSAERRHRARSCSPRPMEIGAKGR
jgi:hypothetical protein